jgi:hypothetical protein
MAPRPARILYNFEPCEEGEIAVHKGDVIFVTYMVRFPHDARANAQDSDGWWTGRVSSGQEVGPLLIPLNRSNCWVTSS